MMHIKNILIVLDATVSVYLECGSPKDELSLNTIERNAKSILEYVERERAGKVEKSALDSRRQD